LIGVVGKEDFLYYQTPKHLTNMSHLSGSDIMIVMCQDVGWFVFLARRGMDGFESTKFSL
jgi:hypothetical protein